MINISKICLVIILSCFSSLHPLGWREATLLGIAKTKKCNNFELLVARFFLATGVSPNALDKGNIWEDNPGSAAFVDAAGEGNTELVQLFIAYKVNLELKHPWDGRTALMDASLYKQKETLKLLIDRGANVNATNCSGQTALIWASSHGYNEIAEILVNAGADVNVQDEDGRTALNRAKRALFAHTEADKIRYNKIVELLKKNGAK